MLFKPHFFGNIWRIWWLKSSYCPWIPSKNPMNLRSFSIYYRQNALQRPSPRNSWGWRSWRHDIVQALAEKKQRTVYRLTLVKVGSWAILDVGLGQNLWLSILVGWTSINPSYFDVNYRGTRFWHTAMYVCNVSQLVVWIHSYRFWIHSYT